MMRRMVTNGWCGALLVLAWTVACGPIESEVPEQTARGKAETPKKGELPACATNDEEAEARGIPADERASLWLRVTRGVDDPYIAEYFDKYMFKVDAFEKTTVTFFRYDAAAKAVPYCTAELKDNFYTEFTVHGAAPDAKHPVGRYTLSIELEGKAVPYPNDDKEGYAFEDNPIWVARNSSSMRNRVFVAWFDGRIRAFSKDGFEKHVDEEKARAQSARDESDL